MLKLLFSKEYIFLWILVILITVFEKKVIGFFGELWVRFELKKLGKNYKVLNNVIVRTEDNSTHQIDHVIISKYGIFVIETKQINGYIKGNDYDKNWTIKRGKNTYFIHNPIHQNYGHVKALSKVLNIDEHKFIPLVCISSQAKIKVNSSSVFKLFNLVSQIKQYKEEILSNYEEVYSFLVNRNIKGYSNSRMHVKNVKQIKKVRTNELNNKCPLCGGELIKRQSKYGSFIGCSNYPRCKFKK